MSEPLSREQVERLREQALAYRLPLGAERFIAKVAEDWLRLKSIEETACEYRRIALADPTSLDLPPAGSRLDRALSEPGLALQKRPFAKDGRRGTSGASPVPGSESALGGRTPR